MTNFEYCMGKPFHSEWGTYNVTKNKYKMERTDEMDEYGR
jgi:hypothetical protein